ncbi:MAG: hypothetical protein JNJ57_11975 [Saprospiraceae bacterium]|nr:hypothetical protein [Saprospiraceae bacterium]
MNSYFKRLRAVWFPDEFHGWGRTRRYFEGWYFKLVSPEEDQAIAVIPGISFGESGHHQAFIQVMNGKTCSATFHAFPVDQFQPSSGLFELRLAGNYFSKNKIVLDLPGLKGEIDFHDLQPWPKMLGAPGIMGWYSFVPFMECNHGVVSLNHHLSGRLEIGGIETNFTGGKGYTEKDWGRSFPRAYVWMQSNHFDTHDRASLMASVAHIPWLKSHFIGFISGFWLDGRLFKFATYTGARKHLHISDTGLELNFKSPKLELRIQAFQARGTPLRSPISGEMTGKIQESLLATVHVELLENKKRIFEGKGRNAGLEVAGNVEVLMR